MTSRALRLVFWVPAALGLASAPCACTALLGAEAPEQVSDAGSDATSIPDAQRDAQDASADGPGDSPVSPQGDAPTNDSPSTEARFILPGSGFQVWGVKSNGQAIVTSLVPPQPVFAVPVDGGTPTTVLSSLPSQDALVVDDVVLVWSVASGSNSPALTIWDGVDPATLASTSSLAGFGAVYGGFAYVVGNVTGSTGDLVQVTLGTPFTTTVVETIELPQYGTLDPCFPKSQLTTGALYLGVCAAGDGGSVGVSVDAFDVKGVRTSIATGVASGWSADTAGDRVFVATSSGAGQVRDATGNIVVTVDQNVSEGAMLPSGTAAIYVSSGSLWRAAAQSPPMAVSLAAVAGGLWGLSPTGAYALYSTTARTGPGDGLGPTADLVLVPTAGGASVTLSSSPATAPVAFTTDESHETWIVTSASEIPSLYAGATAGGAQPVLLGQSLPDVVPLGGSKLVYGNLKLPFQSATLTADVYILDVNADAGQGTLAVSGANFPYAVTPALDAVVYGSDTSMPGLYVQPLP